MGVHLLSTWHTFLSRIVHYFSYDVTQLPKSLYSFNRLCFRVRCYRHDNRNYFVKPSLQGESEQRIRWRCLRRPIWHTKTSSYDMAALE